MALKATTYASNLIAALNNLEYVRLLKNKLQNMHSTERTNLFRLLVRLFVYIHFIFLRV